ncbi:MAG: gluconate 2-dehydrogenase subunit 3 family protein [Candidatus Dormibacteraeota bacterium]|nr:gluconate 2-dehydrogenase subunit 3 family protein [Candidatus Dormibacteraeota bacterium]
MTQRDHWDQQTRDIVLARLTPGPERSFFTEEEDRVCRPLLERLLAGDEGQHKVPVFELIDHRLADGWTDGWRYEDMPPDADAWRASLAELQRRSFATMAAGDQRRLLEAIRTSERFADMPASRLWGLWMRYACTAYYSHPWAWSEIGFGGPAYPRGYKNIGVGKREPWEVEEVDSRDPVPWAERVEAARNGVVAKSKG